MSESGVTQAQLAAGAGVSESQMSRYLAGHKTMTVTELAGVANVLGVSVAYLVAISEAALTYGPQADLEGLDEVG